MSARDPGPPGWFAADGGILPEVVEQAQRLQADLTRRDVVFDPLGLPYSHIPHLPLEPLRRATSDIGNAYSKDKGHTIQGHR